MTDAETMEHERQKYAELAVFDELGREHGWVRIETVIEGTTICLILKRVT